ncbi:MAG: twin-arginine translocation signal domain-containing protein [Longimicrobiaceae bacterium]
MLRRDFLKAAAATAVLTATLPFEPGSHPLCRTPTLPTSTASTSSTACMAPASRSSFFTVA